MPFNSGNLSIGKDIYLNLNNIHIFAYHQFTIDMNMNLKNTLLILLILITCNPITGANYYFKQLDIQNGLSQNSVFCITQDSKGFMWFGTKDGLNRYDGYSFKTYRREEGKQSLRNNAVTCISEDMQHTLWIGTEKGISCHNLIDESFSNFNVNTQNNDSVTEYIRMIIPQNENIWILTGHRLLTYNINNRKLKQIDLLNNDNSLHIPSALCIDKDNVVWICLEDYGIIKYQFNSNQIIPVHLDAQMSASTICDYQNNFLLVGTRDNGLYKLNKLTGYCEKIVLDEKESKLFVRDIKQISPFDAWIGTENGIYIYNEKSITHLTHNPFDNYSLSDNAIYSIYKDQEDGIWIGSYFGGTNYIPRDYSFFEKYYPLKNRNSINGNRIREFCEDEYGNLFIATEDAGINYLNTQTSMFTYITQHSKPLHINYYNVQCLSLHKDELWVGTFSKGIDVINLKSLKTRHYEKNNTPYSLNNNDIFAIYTDKTGTTWIGTSTELAKYDREEDGFITMNKFGTIFVSDIMEDQNGYLWFATYNIGAIRYNPRTEEVKRFSYKPNDPTTICYDKITTIFEDSKNRLWFGSEDGGFCIFDRMTETFKRITTADGLPSNVVHKILEDDNQSFWISTNNGLVHYNPDTNMMQNFNTSSGLLSKQFNYNSGIKGKDGKLYFGSINGMISFNPHEFKKNDYIPSVVLTDFQIFNQSVSIQQEGSALQKSISYTDTIRLNYKQSSFSFSFSALSYTASEMNKYSYKLEGIDNDWLYSDHNNMVSYSNITPGKYIFRVKASNDNGEWNDKETSVYIIITPPWWETTWAYCLYFLITAGIICIIIKLYIRKARRKNERKQKILERKKKEEIYSAKIEFFTNIAHEIRTPLTLIKAPLDYILSNNINKDELTENLQTMERNTERLLNLINQLLDFRKTESKIFSLNLEKTNINELIYSIYIRFKSVAEQKGLEIKIELPEEPVTASVDKEAIIKICSNLFTNAIKYSKSYIHIFITQNSEHKYFEVRVNNDGEPIPMEFREKIFEAFFQIENESKPTQTGSGIGLALANSLAQLHKGQIFIDNKQTDCTSFVIHMPISTELSPGIDNVLQKPEETENIPEPILNEIIYNNKTTILIVEDNEELQTFISEKLSKHYEILTANNGAEALEVMEKHKINIIISDIIMPIMDGIELCKNIKSNIQTCHIPVILLTAKTNLNSKIEGLKSGADAYIEKPFSMSHLLVQVSNLLENHEKLRKNFVSNPFIETNTIAQTKADEIFLNRLTEVVKLNIEEENFSVDELASAMNMSRTSLHRKIKGISELTPGDFIRLVRLKRAAELLQEGEYRINEICILVGFHSQSYFTKSFYKQFGVLPKDFIKKNIRKE